MIRRTPARGTVLAVALTATLALSLALAASASAFFTGYPAYSTYSPSPIDIPDNATLANPLEAQVAAPGTITNVRVYLLGLTHQNVTDLDIMIESPAHKFVYLTSDACNGVAFTDFGYTFDDSNPAPLGTGNGSCGTTAVQPTNYGSPDTWTTAPGAAPTLTLSTFNGDLPSGTWRLHIADDAAVDLGSIRGFLLDVDTTEPDATQIPLPTVTEPSKGPGDALTFTLAGQPSPIGDLNVNIFGFKHTYIDDVTMVLQSPSGKSMLLMTQSCGSADANDFAWTFDDEAATQMPPETDPSCAAGAAFQPSNFSAASSVPGAPVAPYAISLASFDGENPNGVWKLYPYDTTGGDVGYIKGFSVSSTLPIPPAIVAAPKTVSPSNPTFTFKAAGKKISASARVTLTGTGITAADCVGSATSLFQAKKVVKKGTKKTTRLIKVTSVNSALTFVGGSCGFDIKAKIPAKYAGTKLPLTVSHAANAQLAAFTGKSTEKIKKPKVKKSSAVTAARPGAFALQPRDAPLTESTILITGASDGLGRATAIRLPR